MLVPSRDLFDRFDGGKAPRPGRLADHLKAEAELARSTGAPAMHGAGLSQRTGMSAARSNPGRCHRLCRWRTTSLVNGHR